MKEKILTEKYLSDLIAEAFVVKEFVKNKFTHLSSEQINWKFDKNKWSIAQCLEHLIISDNAYFLEIEKSISGIKEKDKKGENYFKSGFLGKLFLFYTDPNSSKKFEAVDAFKPSDNIMTANIFNSFNEHQNKLMSLLEDCRNLNLSATKVAHPVNRLIKFRLGDFFNLIITHEKRHLLQAEKVVNHQFFPKQVLVA